MISVIIPVYNVENYLEGCINSVLSQRYENFELLLINDGSTDSSGAICDNFAKLDHRVRIFHKANGGVSSARNIGLEKANGKWVTFLDSDDLLSENYFDCLCTTNICDIDWILLNANKFDANYENSILNYKEGTLGIEIFLKEYKLFPHFSSPWAKIYKRNLINNHYIRFEESLSLGEDALFNINYLRYVRNICIHGKGHYRYRDAESSLSKKPSDFQKDFNIYLKLRNALEQQIPSIIEVEKHLGYAIYRAFFSILYSKESIKERKEKIKFLLNEHGEFLYNRIKKDPSKIRYFAPLVKYCNADLLLYLFYFKI